MKSCLIVCGVVLSLVVLPAASQAGLIADWTYSVTATGPTADSGALSPAIDDGSSYDCDFYINKVEILYTVFGGSVTVDVTGDLFASQLEKHVTDVPGPLPSGTDKLYLFQNMPLSLNGDFEQVFSLNVSSYLDSDGKGHIELTNVSRGYYYDIYPVAEVTLSGTEHVATVPEPISLGLLGVGAIGLVARRRR